MSTPTHTIVGLVVATLAIHHHLVPNDPVTVNTVAVMASNLPDLDIVFVIRNLKRNHRESFMHYPMFWAIFLLVSMQLVRIVGRTDLIPYLAISSIAIFTHFILDTFDPHSGIRWFAPFFKKSFRLLPKEKQTPITVRDFLFSYTHHPVMILEAMTWIGSIITMMRR